VTGDACKRVALADIHGRSQRHAAGTNDKLFDLEPGVSAMSWKVIENGAA
jgi:hypothetical protein